MINRVTPALSAGVSLKSVGPEGSEKLRNKYNQRINQIDAQEENA